MTRHLDRRDFLRCGLAAAAVPAGCSLLAPPVAAQTQPPPGAEKLTHYQLGPQIWVRWNNRPLTSYRAHPTQKYPYFYPLVSPVSGLPLTSETALPWPHHRSLFFGCDRVNGGNYWQTELERGQIISTGSRVDEATDSTLRILDECQWSVPGQPVQMTDRRQFTVTVASPRLWLLDAQIDWTAVQDVAIERTNHALFSIRAAVDITPWGGGTLVSSEGDVGEQATFGKPARWCAFYGPRTPDQNGTSEGIALLDHPRNPWNPCPWFTRDYGFVSPMPFNWLEQPWRLPAGQSVQLKYRVVAFAGDPQEAQLDTLHQQWAQDEPK